MDERIRLFEQIIASNEKIPKKVGSSADKIKEGPLEDKQRDSQNKN